MILALYGAGAIGRDVKFIAEEEGKWPDIVFIDDIATGSILDCPVYSFQDFKKKYDPSEVSFLITVGEIRFKKELYDKMKMAGYTAAAVFHPDSFVASDAQIGEGIVVSPGAYIGSAARIGLNVFVSHNASIGHDTVIGDHVAIGSGAFIGGHTIIENDVHIGANASLKDRIRVGKGSNIALGASVFSDIPDDSSVIGNPARIMDGNSKSLLYEPSRAIIDNREKSPDITVAEKYWDVFSDCFTGTDFNPVSFRFRDEGWDSIRQMTFIARLEESFDISLKGREALKVNSYESGLTMVKKKLKEKEEG